MSTKKDTEKKQAPRRKKQADPEKVKEALQEYIENVKPFELCWVWKDGDSLQKVAQALTGHVYMDFALLNYNRIEAGDIKPGTILKWGVK